VKLSRRRSLQALTAALAMPSIAGAQAHSTRLIVLDVGGTLLQDRGEGEPQNAQSSDTLSTSNAGLGGMVGVLSGAGTAEQLRRKPHTEIIPSVADLPALLRTKHA
jgi:hypothetical protein